ncbi:MAG TPA: chalcone isomerase family protein [Thermoanaerobaculia bacterium]|nr:chalcone isomerase family protein [Thermoanaerobaculia bacterium]
MRKLLLGGLLTTTLALSALAAAPAGAGTLADVTMPDKIDAGGQALVLNGMGLRKKFVIKVYVAGLYLPAKERSPAKVLAADAPRRMAFHLLFSVSAKQMCDAWEEGLADNTPNATAEVKAGFKALCGAMEDIPKGHEMVLTYQPGQGTRVEVNGKVKATIPGKPVSDAVLATWIGPHPGPGEDFKQAVLGAP